MNIQPVIDALVELEEFLKTVKDNYPPLLEKYRILFQAAQEKNDEKFFLETFEKFKPYLYGGMGSLNDLYISEHNNHVFSDKKLANERLKWLLEQLKTAFDACG